MKEYNKIKLKVQIFLKYLSLAIISKVQAIPRHILLILYSSLRAHTQKILLPPKMRMYNEIFPHTIKNCNLMTIEPSSVGPLIKTTLKTNALTAPTL